MENYKSKKIIKYILGKSKRKVIILIFIFFWNTKLCKSLNSKKKKNALNIDYIDNMLFIIEKIKDLIRKR